MHSRLTCPAMAAAMMIAAAIPCFQAATAAAPAAPVLQVQPDDMQSLKDSLLTLAEQRLQPMGLFVDRERAWMTLSGSLSAAGQFEVRPLWPADARVPPLPLTFELQPRSTPSAPANARPIKATLAAPLLRDVWVAARRLRKGSLVTCADLSVQRRDIRSTPQHALTLPCEIESEAVARRDIAARDVVRGADIGRAPDVMAGAPVRVSVANKGINVTTTAVALADARVGDQIDVRLTRPARTLKTRVTGPGAVQLMDTSP